MGTISSVASGWYAHARTVTVVASQTWIWRMSIPWLSRRRLLAMSFVARTNSCRSRTSESHQRHTIAATRRLRRDNLAYITSTTQGPSLPGEWMILTYSHPVALCTMEPCGLFGINHHSWKRRYREEMFIPAFLERQVSTECRR